MSLEKDIRSRLGKLPEGLKDAYDELYDRIQARSESERRIADSAFQWVMCACAPLTTEELLPAVCQDINHDTFKSPGEDIDEDLVLELCHNFLTIDPTRGVWVPSHLSVIEYFENHRWSQKQANCLAASVCLLLLNDPAYNGQEDSSGNRASYGFYIYARHHWMTHVKNYGEEGIINDRLSALVKRFLGSPSDSSVAYRQWHAMIGGEMYKDIPRSSFYDVYPFSLSDLEPSSSAT